MFSWALCPPKHHLVPKCWSQPLEEHQVSFSLSHGDTPAPRPGLLTWMGSPGKIPTPGKATETPWHPPKAVEMEKPPQMTHCCFSIVSRAELTLLPGADSKENRETPLNHPPQILADIITLPSHSFLVYLPGISEAVSFFIF